MPDYAKEGHAAARLSQENYRWLKIRRGHTDESIKDMVNTAVSEWIAKEEAKKKEPLPTA